MRKHALKYRRDDGSGDCQPISNKSCQTDILGLDKYLQRSPPSDDISSSNSVAETSVLQKMYKRSPKKPKVRSVAVHCERRRLTMAAFKGCQKFKHVYKRKISLPQPSSSLIPTTTTCSGASADAGRRNRGVLPKLRPDRTTETERPAAAKAGPVVKLPRIPRTRDLKQEPDRTDDGVGGATRLAKLTRPQSTGSSGGGTTSSGDQKLAYFRANSAPKVNSRYYGRFDPSQLIQPPPRNEREQQSTTPGSTDTGDTTLDMSFVREQQPPGNVTVASTNSTTRTVTTATVSTSTSFAEPIFPIVFSCESVLRHPLDGGYVSHTESHRFSVHYTPVEDAKATAATDTDDGSRSSLVFTSAGACQNKQCLTGDSISVTLGSKPDDSAVSQHDLLSTSTSTSTLNTIGERRLVIEHINTDVQSKNVSGNGSVPDETIVDVTSSADCRSPTDENLYSPEETGIDTDDKNVTKTQDVGFYVLGKSNVINQDVNMFEKATVPPIPANKNIDNFDDDGEEKETAEKKKEKEKEATEKKEKEKEKEMEKEKEGTIVPHKSHARTDDMPLQSDEQNYERLTQNHQIVVDANRAVSNQSPKPDGTETKLSVVKRQNNLKPVGNDNAHAIDILSNTQSTIIESTKPSTDSNLTIQSEITELLKRSTIDEPVPKINDNKYLDQLNENLVNMACKQHCCNGLMMGKRGTERDRTNTYENTNRPTYLENIQHCESIDKRNFINRRNVPPNRLQDDMSRKRDENREERMDRNPYHISSRLDLMNHLNTRHRHNESTTDRQNYIFDDFNIVHNRFGMNNVNSVNNQHSSEQLGVQTNNLMNGKRSISGRLDINSREYDRVGPRTENREQYGQDTCQRANSHVRVEQDDANTCRRCTNSLSLENNDTRNGNNDLHYTDHNMNHSRNSHYDAKYPMPKHRLESVDESMESTKASNNYIGGFLFGDGFYNKQRPEKFEADNERDGRSKYGYYDDAKKVNFSTRLNDRYEYYQDYTPKTCRYSPRNEDCTVFANMPQNSGDNKTYGVRHDRYTSTAAEPEQTSYYSKLNNKASCEGDDKNTDSDESLTDSLEDGKYEGAAISYFLALDGQKSAVTFTLKMPNTLESRLNQRHSQLKKHLHVSTTVTKKQTSTRVRTRHKGCQTLWTEEKGVQVQRGSTAIRKPVEDHKVLETLLAGLQERNRVSENQIRVVGGQKMVSEGNQTEQPAGGWPSDRQTQTRAMTKDTGVGPRTPENNTGVAGGRNNKGQQHTMKKFSSDNALMVGVVRQNKYKGKESLDGTAKNDQLLTLSKGWINFYTLRADSADTDVQGN